MASYTANDAVRHGNGQYRAGVNILPSDNLVPGVSPYWVLLVSDGATGNTGPIGTSITVTNFTSRAAYDAYTPTGNTDFAIYTGSI